MANDALSDYFKLAVANWYRGTTFPTVGANHYVSLHTAAPDSAGSDETNSSNAPGYARIAIAATTGAWNAPVLTNGGEMISNVAAITFAAATAGWPVLTGVGLWTASTAGNFLAGGALDAPIQLLNGEQIYFPAGYLMITFGPTLQ